MYTAKQGPLISFMTKTAHTDINPPVSVTVSMKWRDARKIWLSNRKGRGGGQFICRVDSMKTETQAKSSRQMSSKTHEMFVAE